MGMYTEILIKACVKNDIPDQVENVLQYLFNNKEKPIILPNHSFFLCPRWSCIGRGCSYYHIPWITSRYSDGYIFSRSDLKNYDNEIENFFDWIKPFLSGPKGLCIGYWWYEEDQKPTLVYI